MRLNVEKCIRLLDEEVTVKDAPDAIDWISEEKDIIGGRAGKVIFENDRYSIENFQKLSSSCF